MIWSPARNFCFIHVPKTGGTAVELAYKPHLRFGDVVLAAWHDSLDTWYGEHLHIGKHSPAAGIARELGPDRFRQVFSFAILRDPLDRMVSYYRWIQSFKHRGEDERRLRAHRDFESFVEAAAEGFAPQADMVCDRVSGLPMVTMLAPYPRLADAWRLVSGRLGLTSALPVANASADIPVEITARAREIVARRYTRDAELLRRVSQRWDVLHPRPPAHAAGAIASQEKAG